MKPTMTKYQLMKYIEKELPDLNEHITTIKEKILEAEDMKIIDADSFDKWCSKFTKDLKPFEEKASAVIDMQLEEFEKVIKEWNDIKKYKKNVLENMDIYKNIIEERILDYYYDTDLDKNVFHEYGLKLVKGRLVEQIEIKDSKELLKIIAEKNINIESIVVKFNDNAIIELIKAGIIPKDVVELKQYNRDDSLYRK